jgi:hypothetical protein
MVPGPVHPRPWAQSNGLGLWARALGLVCVAMQAILGSCVFAPFVAMQAIPTLPTIVRSQKCIVVRPKKAFNDLKDLRT